MYPSDRLGPYLKQDQTVNVRLPHLSQLLQAPSKPHAVHGLQGNVGHASRFKSNLLASKLLHLPEYHLVMSSVQRVPYKNQHHHYHGMSKLHICHQNQSLGKIIWWREKNYVNKCKFCWKLYILVKSFVI